jgi:hypothetical protein
MHHDENFTNSRALSQGKKPKGDPGGKGATPTPREAAVMTIFG